MIAVGIVRSGFFFAFLHAILEKTAFLLYISTISAAFPFPAFGQTGSK
jgi:hypothetical protein